MINEHDGIDLDQLMAAAARDQGLDPDKPSSLTGPMITHAVNSFAPTIFHIDIDPYDLRWMAAGFYALARAAELAAGGVAYTGAPTPVWSYTITDDQARLQGPLLHARSARTVGVLDKDLAGLVTTLGTLRAEPAYRRWWDINTDTQAFWRTRESDGAVHAHTHTQQYPEIPDADEWVEVDAVDIELRDIGHLYMGLAAILSTRTVPPTATKDSAGTANGHPFLRTQVDGDGPQ